MTDYLAALLHREAFESNHSTRLHTGPPLPEFGHIAHDWVQLPEATPLQSRSRRVIDAQDETLPRGTLWNTSSGVATGPALAAGAVATTVMVRFCGVLMGLRAMLKVPDPTIVKTVPAEETLESPVVTIPEVPEIVYGYTKHAVPSAPLVAVNVSPTSPVTTTFAPIPSCQDAHWDPIVRAAGVAEAAWAPCAPKTTPVIASATLAINELTRLTRLEALDRSTAVAWCADVDAMDS
jgi:hypothetical protein